MLDFIIMPIIWLIILFFSSAEFYTKFKVIKAFFASTFLNLILLAVCTLIWFSMESDGIAQIIGGTIYAILFGIYTLITGLIYFILYRYRLKRNK